MNHLLLAQDSNRWLSLPHHCIAPAAPERDPDVTIKDDEPPVEHVIVAVDYGQVINPNVLDQ
jgi:hypothetical protein